VRILGVLDLAGGRAVHARAGRREQYAPVRQVGETPIASGDAGSVATVYRDRLGIGELYVADLDAITGGLPQRSVVAALAEQVPLWLDAGISTPEAALAAIDSGATGVVVGLETLSSFEALASICTTVGGDRVAFSLDLRDGHAIYRPGALAPDTSAGTIAARAAKTGAATLIVIDLARVGMGAGLDVPLIAGVREAAPEVSLIAGGGIRGLDDVVRIAAAGCNGVLIASALHDGRMTAADVAAARRLQPSVSR
jgi:phosphoribosylformimino-5-aminoimidazole carboxamide ribotide isomerase